MLSSVLYFLVNLSLKYIFLEEKPANTLFFDSDGHSINPGRSLRILRRRP